MVIYLFGCMSGVFFIEKKKDSLLFFLTVRNVKNGFYVLNHVTKSLYALMK